MFTDLDGCSKAKLNTTIYIHVDIISTLFLLWDC